GFHEDAGVESIGGITGDPISTAVNMSLDYSQYDNFIHQFVGVPDDISDTMILASDAAPILYDDTGGVAGVRYPRPGKNSAGRVVFLSFPLDAVPATGADPNNRAALLRGIVSFLVPGLNGRATVALDSPAYNLPSFVVVEVGDA